MHPGNLVAGYSRSAPQAAALEVRAEEVLGAGARHRGRRADLERERRCGHDLGEAVHGAGPAAAHQREPFARGRETGATADGADLEAGEADRRVQAALDTSPRPVR